MDKNEKNNSEIILYQAEDGKTHIEVRLQDETVWLTQAAMAELYQTTPSECYFAFEGHLCRGVN